MFQAVQSVVEGGAGYQVGCFTFMQLILDVLYMAYDTSDGSMWLFYRVFYGICFLFGLCE